MYKKITLLTVTLSTFTTITPDATPWIEIKPSYFTFSNCLMSEIYDKGGFEVQASGSIPVYKRLDIYTSIGYRQSWGHALSTGEKTNLIVIPFDIGLKPVFNFSDHAYYFCAAGPRFFFFHQHNKSAYVNCIINDTGIGLFINSGFNVLLKDHFLFGLFAEYSYEPTNVSSTKQNVFSNGNVSIGGFAVGVNFGYAF